MQVVRRIPLRERVPESQQGNKTVSRKDYKLLHLLSPTKKKKKHIESSVKIRFMFSVNGVSGDSATLQISS